MSCLLKADYEIRVCELKVQTSSLVLGTGMGYGAVIGYRDCYEEIMRRLSVSPKPSCRD